MKKSPYDVTTPKKATDKTENPSIDEQLRELAVIIVELILNHEYDKKIKKC